MSSLATTLFSGRCPICQEGALFKGPFELHAKCPTCGAVYQRDPGSWTGATVVGYMSGTVYAMLCLIMLVATGEINRPGIEWFVVLSTCGFQLIALRAVKAAWVGILADMEQVYADPPEEVPVSVPS